MSDELFAVSPDWAKRAWVDDAKYKAMYDAYFEERGLIPKSRLHEVAFEDLERDPIAQVRQVDETLDHKMLLHCDDPVIPELRRQGEPFVELDVNPTAENIARLIYDRTAAAGFPVVEVTLWETETSFATYRGTKG